MTFTQDGHHDVIFHNFNGTSGDEVERDYNVALVDQSVAGGSMCGLKLHGQRPAKEHKKEPGIRKEALQ